VSASARAPASRSKNERPFVLALGLGAVYAAGVGTQVVAYRLGYHANLGAPLYSVSPRHVVSYRVVAAMLTLFAVLLAAFGGRRPAAAGWAVALLLAALGVWAASLGPIYAPYRVALWAHAYERVPRLADVTRSGLLAAGTALPVVWGLMFATRPPRHDSEASASHGSARWGEAESLLGSRGLIVEWDSCRSPSVETAV
jgi:hypothetical protein